MLKHLLILVSSVVLVGCKPAGGGGGAPAAPAATPAILQPFQGNWRFSLTKTLAQWQADGVPAAEIAQAKALAVSFPLHPDMSICGTRAILVGGRPVEGSYDFFALHPHNAWPACGKAWHHEDRHDLGDMDKWCVRLQIKAGDLHMPLRGDENPPNMNDPDIVTAPPLAGSAATCTADGLANPPWSPWRTYVFQRVERLD
jgi:hypothetical protein